MAARLLDNEALGQDYQVATLADILRDHVSPYGITVASQAYMAPVSQFSVAVGSSEWSVLYDFVRYYHSISPRFDWEGRLVLTPWEDNTRLLLDDATPVTKLVCRDKRYGVLSQVVVRDRYQQLTQVVNNTDFQALGGSRRQVLTMPGKSQYQAMRYSGQFQLDQSATEQLVLEVTIPVLFYGKPGDLVQLQRSDWGRDGLYRATRLRSGWTRAGAGPVWSSCPPKFWCEVKVMWTSNRKQDGRTQEAPGDVGVVTLGGDPAGVYLSEERRWVAVYAPGGYQWRPAVGEKVLVLKAGDHQESPCLVGVRQSEQQLEPGGVRLSGGEGQIDLCKDGIRLTGQVWIGEQTLEDYVSAIAREVTLEILGGG